MAGFPIIPGTLGAAKQLTGTSFTPTQTGLYLVRIAGGGGGGGAGSSAIGSTSRASGGAGGAPGATAEALMTLTAGTAYTWTPGTAGAGGTVTTGGTHNGGNGGNGGNSTFAGPTTLQANGGGGGQGGLFVDLISAATISGQIVTLTLANGLGSLQRSDFVVITGASGGAWANLNGTHYVISSSGGTLILLCLSGTIPSGTYTAFSGSAQAFCINAGIVGSGDSTLGSYLWAPGYAAENVVFGASWVQNAGTGNVGIPQGPGGAGGASTNNTDSPASSGGTGGGAGTTSPGASGSNGGNSGGGTPANGTNGGAAAANTGAGGGGGGAAASTGNAGQGGAGGTGFGMILGPF